MKNIAATGGVHRLDFEGGSMAHLAGSVFADIPAAGAAGGNDHDFTIRLPQGQGRAGGIFFSSKFFGEALREEQMVHQMEQLLKLGSVSALEIRDDGSSILLADSGGANHARHADVIDEQHFRRAKKFLRRP